MLQHSKLDHLVALLKVAKEMGVPKVFIHFFGDGRDTDPKSGLGHLKTLLQETKDIGIGELATIVGRYYIMDRDKRWERVEVGLKALVEGDGEATTDPVKTVEERYANGETDEFLKPIIVGGKERRIQGAFFHVAISLLAEILQMVILSSTSTTARIASANPPSSWVTLTAPLYPTSLIPRTST